MNLLKQLDEAVKYIESNLCDELDMDELAHIACVTADSFCRFFSYISSKHCTSIYAQADSGYIQAHDYKIWIPVNKSIPS